MLSNQKSKIILRSVILVLLAIGVMGPWWFDRISVPAQYPCNPPVMRLEGDFCGVPASGSYIIFAFASLIVQSVGELITGKLKLGANEAGQFSLVIVFLVFLILPFISTILLMIKRELKSLRWLQIIAMGIAAGIALYGVFSIYDVQISWVLWGIWLYAGAAIISLISELLVLLFASRKKAGPSLAA